AAPPRSAEPWHTSTNQELPILTEEFSFGRAVRPAYTIKTPSLAKRFQPQKATHGIPTAGIIAFSPLWVQINASPETQHFFIPVLFVRRVRHERSRLPIIGLRHRPRYGSVVLSLHCMNDPQPEGHMASYIRRRKFLATLGGV